MSLAVTAAAALISVPVSVPAQAVAAPGPDRQAGRPGLDRPTCAAPGNREFPVRTRIHGGPTAYDAGGGFRTWYIDLTNTTDATCGNIHPIVVLVDGKRALKPEQPRLEFYDGERPRPVTFERTDEDESIGILGAPEGGPKGDPEREEDAFPGFTVPPGATLSVKMRLAITSDAVANDVVANAAVVQRHEDDGEWVGQSNDYRFRIVDEGDGSDEGDGDDGGGKEDAGDAGVTGDPDGTPDGGDAPTPVPDGIPFAEELARTGLDSPRAILAATAGALLLLGAGVAALLTARRRR
ncbi:hypothetical protein [Streptomyces albicerus]|uniref:hypothetical protein n=1 Tax=Streptomyces albicerus TaxID=2569859 RepID=UPI00298E0320|nr:hypothetical protein [Streptomyces albicerus]